MTTGTIVVKRERPPMPPLSVRVKVAERQFVDKFPKGWDVYRLLKEDWSLARRLKWLLFTLFNDGKGNALPCALDHDPALILRPYNPRVKDVAARYTPHAHDPDALLYREKANHQQKTTGRRPGAERTITTKGSDIGIKTKFARLERKKEHDRLMKMPEAKFNKMLAGLPKIRLKIPSQPFSKGPKQKIPQRKNPWPKRKMRDAR